MKNTSYSFTCRLGLGMPSRAGKVMVRHLTVGLARCLNANMFSTNVDMKYGVRRARSRFLLSTGDTRLG